MPSVKKRPFLDMAECNDCDACLEMSPSVFQRMDSGVIWVVDLDEYPEEEIDECIRNCPCQCIGWEEA
jgi:ferredoxin